MTDMASHNILNFAYGYKIGTLSNFFLNEFFRLFKNNYYLPFIFGIVDFF